MAVEIANAEHVEGEREKAIALGFGFEPVLGFGKSAAMFGFFDFAQTFGLLS